MAQAGRAHSTAERQGIDQGALAASGCVAPAQVAAGLFSVRLPVPFSPWHVNAWLVEDGAGWTIIDTGTGDAASKTLWEQVFADHLAGRPVTRVIVTHFHLDHVGLAGWLCARFGAPLWMARTEWLQARAALSEDAGLALTQQQRLHRMAGCSDGFLAYLAQTQAFYTSAVKPLPACFVRLRDGDDVVIGDTRWQVLAAAGHAPEQICLFDAGRNLLIAADHVLETISPYIGVVAAEPEGDPLGDYLAALDRFKALPPETLVLPSHGAPFHGLHERIDALLAGHARRLDQIIGICDQPRTAADIASRLFRRALEHRQMKFAVGETLAHLNLLIRQKRVVRNGLGEAAHLYAVV
ncbi:MBL fold metallo-hydrolase [Phreatobacter stygius]|uniref:MBL fold metallo-hydrolase n=1 Tax=Phreatobacter stygius TaxID=1940610 RepID=UPI001476BDBC|nr:MBL fold metallo-hydrolase [Phreatobacter stygius]